MSAVRPDNPQGIAYLNVYTVVKNNFSLSNAWAETERIYDLYQKNASCTECGKLALSAPQPSLTKAACIDFLGNGPHHYDRSSIWSRMTTWKLPLVQVVASFPRPPLSLKIELFVMAHLLGDPIDTAQNLSLKIARCQDRVKDWKDVLERFNLPIEVPDDTNQDQIALDRREKQIAEWRWKHLALVTDAYDEWGQAEHQMTVMKSAPALTLNL